MDVRFIEFDCGCRWQIGISCFFLSDHRTTTKLECWCCGKVRPDVRHRERSGLSGRLLCEPCWADPAVEKAKCRHGQEPAEVIA